MRKLLLLYLLFFSVWSFAQSDTTHQHLSVLEIANEPIASTLLSEAYVAYEVGKLDTALTKFQNVLQQLIPGFNAADRQTNPDEKSLFANSLLVKALEGKAKVYERKAADEKSSSESLEHALSCRELMIEADRHLMHSGGNYQKTHYDQLIDQAYNLYAKTNDPSILLRVFRLVETCRKARSLENLRDPATGLIANVPDDLIKKQNLEKRQLDQLLNNFMEAKGSANEAEAEATYKENRKKYQNRLFDIKKDYPDFYRLMYNESVVTIGEIQNRLADKDEALLTYYETENYLYAFVVTLNGYRATRMRKEYPLRTWVSDLRAHIVKAESGDCSDYTQLAHEIYQRVVRPVGVLPLKVIIVPDGALAQLPFNALLSGKVEGCNFRNFPYLLKQHQISYHYGPDLFAKAAYRDHSDYDGFVGFSTSADLGAVKKLMSGKVFSGESLNEATFKSHTANTSLVHMALPATTNTDEVDRFYIELPDRLSSKTIYDLDLDVQLAVLTECVIGSGNDRLLELVQGFQYAGAQSVLATFWKSDAQTNQKLMLDFYTHLKNGVTKDAAFHKACLALWDDKKVDRSHPKNWAAFAPVGDMDAVKEQNWYLYFAGIIPLIAMFYFWRRYTKSKLKMAKAKSKK